MLTMDRFSKDLSATWKLLIEILLPMDINGNIVLHLKFIVNVVLSNSDVIVGAFDQARQNSE
jgi:hypothetical protein